MQKYIKGIYAQLTPELYLFVISVASFLLSIHFAYKSDIAQFYGFLFVFLIATVLLIPNVIEYLKMPGFELKRIVKEARDLTNEIRIIARKLAETSIRLAFKSSGWVDVS